MEKVQALQALGFELDKGVYKKLLCEKEGTTYTLTCEPHRSGFKVDKRSPDGAETTDGAGKYRDTPIYEKMEEIVKALDEKMKEETAPEDTDIFDAPNQERIFSARGDDYSNIQDTTYENIGEQKKVPLPKPGRRIKNMVSELMEGGTIRAGEKVINAKTGKVNPTKTDYFIITTKTRKNAKDKNQPDLGYEKDEEIHKLIGDDRPKKLKVRLACDREDLNFITYYGKYKSAMCECRGDGYSAETSNGELIECHGEDCESFKKKECKKHGVLSVILEDAPRFGIVYKFRTTSRNSISYLDASLALLTAGLNGHIAGAPLWLTLTPKETVVPDGPQKGMRTIIYAANLEFRGTRQEMEAYLQKTLTERAGKDPILGVERVMEAALSLPESPEEQKDVAETFFPE
jgi:hypothetical protein